MLHCFVWTILSCHYEWILQILENCELFFFCEWDIFNIRIIVGWVYQFFPSSIFVLSLSFFFSSVFLDRALKLLHVNQFVVEAVFFIFRDIYKHVQETHSTTTAEWNHLYHTSKVSTVTNGKRKKKSTLPTVSFGIKNAPLFRKVRLECSNCVGFCCAKSSLHTKQCLGFCIPHGHENISFSHTLYLNVGSQAELRNIPILHNHVKWGIVSS